MKKIVCGFGGKIYDATILKDGLMSDRSRRECTDECIDAVAEHLHTHQVYKDRMFAGYKFEKSGVTLMLYNNSRFKLVPIEGEEE